MSKLVLQAWAFLLRDLKIAASYKASLLIGVVSAFALLMVFFFVGSTFGRSPHLASYGGSYFGFAILGLAAAGPLHAALVLLNRRVREAQISGTMEAILAAPIGPARAVLFSAIHPMLGSVVRMALLLGGAALIFELPLAATQLPAALVVLLLALATYAALGLLSASFTLRFKKGDPIAALIDLISVLLGGVFYPVQVLPAPLQATAQLLPLTHALEALRRVLLQGASLAEIAPQLRTLAAAFAVLAPLAWFAFHRALARAKDDGSLTHF